jgi:hypothetical protein
MPPAVQDPSRTESSRPHPERYEPLPGVAGLPRWIWRKLPPPARIAVALFPVVALVVALLLAPGIDESKDERARAESERLARLRAERIRELRAEQRPRFHRSAPAGADVARRTALANSLPAAVTADARARAEQGSLKGPIRFARCEPYPRTVGGRGAELDPDRPTGRYSCLAVTRTVQASEHNEAALIGHPYRVMVHFDTGRYALCKVSGRAGEGSIGTQPLVPVPAACGG